jgi:citronellol/citronellal dehydrogenase
MGAASFFATDLMAGQSVLVTGGGTGIGKAIALAFSVCGARVVIASRSQEHLDQGVADVVAATGVTPLAKVCDIRHPEQVDELADFVVTQHGRIDVLVNNAGGQFAQEAERYSSKGWNAVIDTNLNGTWHMTQAAGRRMIAAGGGCIVSTRIPVWSLEQSRRLGFTDDELLHNYPTLQQDDLTAAWAYVKAHEVEIDHAIRENEED